MLYPDFETILMPVYEQFSVKVNKMKTGRKDEIPYTDETNTPLVFGWCLQSTFAYKDVSDSLKRTEIPNTRQYIDCVSSFKLLGHSSV